MSYIKLKQISYRILFILLLSPVLFGCKQNSNEELFKKSEAEFSNAAIKNKAVNFDYQYDVLTPQHSYFINTDLKYLSFTHEPEAGFGTRQVYFNLTTDSIEKFVARDTHFKQEGLFAGNLDFDSLFIIYPASNFTEIYVGNKLVDTIFNTEYLKQELPFIKAMKHATELKFLSR